MPAAPTGSGMINPDTYLTATPPPTVTAGPAGVKVINGGDKKTGPPKPTSLGGTTTSKYAFPDDYWE